MNNLVKKRYLVLSMISLAASLFLFQNFTPPGTLVSFINPEKGVIVNANGVYKYHDNLKNKNHEVKLEGGGMPPSIFYYKRYDKKFIKFETEGNSEYKDRSEIRIVGSDVEFDEVFYSSFELYYPSTSATVDEKEWGLLWQCAQAGDFSTPRSPPLSIQFRNNQLSLVTIHNFNSKSKIVRTETPLVTIQRNKPVLFFMRYRLGGDGGVKIMIDGKTILETRLSIGYADGINPFTQKRSCSVRFGIYKQANPDPMILLFGNVKVGNDYSLVKP